MALGIEEDVELRESARKGYVVGDPRPRSYVSGPVAGELLLVLLKTYPERLDDATRSLARFVNVDGYIELGAHGRVVEGAFEVAVVLMKGDKRLGPTDALVASCSLVDPASNGLVTADPDLLLSDVVVREFDARKRRLIEFEVSPRSAPQRKKRRRQ